MRLVAAVGCALCFVVAPIARGNAECVHGLPDQFAVIAHWSDCLNAAVDHYYRQPEPANTVATAAFSTCEKFELAYRSAGCTVEDAAYMRREFWLPRLLARIMAARAAISRPQ
jgi:hypothetical protein